ncbi:hypothetical protein Ancab_021908 [Ancistrocladus abbreviatus]
MNISMATLPVPTTLSLLFFFFFLFITSLPLSFQTSILTPIQKDHSTHQYTTTVSLKTPPQPTKLTVDLGAPFSWINCQDNYTSTTYRLVPCESALCYSLEHLGCSFCYEPPGPNCGNNTCSLFPENHISNNVTVGDAMVDYLAIPTTDGSNQGPLTIIPNFVLSCAKTYLLKDLAKGVTGMLALGWSNNSLPLQMSRDLSRPNIFALCLSGSRTGSGVGFYGLPGPYNFLPGVDLSKSLTYTPLVINPFSDTIITYALHASYKYFIGVTGIKINGQDVAVNKTLLAIDPNFGVGGTRISTVRPYTVLERSIYRAVTDAFATAAATLKLKAVGPYKPFGLCYDAKQYREYDCGAQRPNN